MNPAGTLAAFGGALVVVFGAAVGVGGLVGPVGTASSASTSATATHATHATPDAETAAGPSAELVPGGLAVSQDGYTLRLAESTVPASPRALLELVVDGPDGAPVTEYVPSHEEELHLIVVRRDLAAYQHVHPTRADDGTWSTQLDLSQPGPYKVFADFVPAGHEEGLTLAADLTVPGTYDPAPLPAPSDSTSVDGYDVTLEGELVAGTSSPVVLSVSRDGRPVTDLQPYLGAYGHLVAVREGDLAYLHVHPDDETGDPSAGPEIAFTAEVPSAATYRLFLDFAHEGVVRTAELTATAGTGTSTSTGTTAPTPAEPAPAPSAGHDSSPHGH